MDVVGSIVNAVVMGAVGLLVAWYTKGRLDALESRIERRIDRLEEANERAHEGLRSDLTQVALAVGARPRAENA